MKTLLVDCKYLLYRSINTQVNLTFNELKTSMHYLFFNTVQSVANKFKVDSTIIMLDSDSSLRREIYPEYKNKRSIGQPKENVIKQLKFLKNEFSTFTRMLQNLGFATYISDGLEADDLFALYCNQFKKHEIIILTRDEDIYQLLDKNRVYMYNPHKKSKITENDFIKEYSITPKEWIEVKAIAGCTSDNVKGIPGLGEKTAIKYLKGEASQNIVSKIEENKNLIDLNRKLVTLPFKNIKLENKTTQLDLDKFIPICQTYGFRSFIESIDKFKIFS